MFRIFVLNIATSILIVLIGVFGAHVGTPLIQLLSFIVLLFLISNYYMHFHGAPVTIKKRRVAVFSLIFVILTILVQYWQLPRDLTSIVLLGTSIWIHLTLMYFLSKVDIQVQEFSPEMFVAQAVASAYIFAEGYWNWSFYNNLELTLTKLMVAVLLILVLLVSYIATRKSHLLYSIVPFIGLSALKILTAPETGVINLMVFLIFSLIIGYIIEWHRNTTDVERKFSKNINILPIYILLVVLGVVLILFT